MSWLDFTLVSRKPYPPCLSPYITDYVFYDSGSIYTLVYILVRILLKVPDMWWLCLVEIIQPMNLLSIWKTFPSQDAQPMLSVAAAPGAGGQHIGAKCPATLLASIRIRTELTHPLPWSSCQPGCFQPRSVNVHLPQRSCQSFTPTPSWQGFAL